MEPLGNFLDVRLAVGVIEVLAGSKNLNRLHAAAGQSIQNAGMEPLFHI